jgi:hypothetical protein
MECRLWGGVSRKTIQKFQPLVLNSIGRAWFPIIEFFTNLEMRKTKYACRKEAKKVVKRIQDYITEGYTIFGILGVNGSPTCGVTKTINYVEIAKNMKKLDIEPQDIINPQLEKIIEIENKTRIDGPGNFFNPLIDELKRNKVNIRVEGIELASDPKKEVERIANLLSLKN